MISLYAEPPRATVADWPGLPGPNVLLMGVLLLTGKSAAAPVLSGICCCEDGTLMVVPAGNITIDYRYDHTKDLWYDLRREEPA